MGKDLARQIPVPNKFPSEYLQSNYSNRMYVHSVDGVEVMKIIMG